MANLSDPLEFRRWALDYSPSVLKRRAVRQWGALASEFGGRLSPFLLERWRAGVFGEETEKELQKYDDQFRDGFLKGTLIEGVMFMASFSESLSEAVGVPVVCDRPPYEVPVDHAHLFDIRIPDIRQSAASAALSDSDLAALRAAVQGIRADDLPDLISAFTAVRPIMDVAIPASLRASDGYGIHEEFVRHWIVFNARIARWAVDRRERRAARESLEKIATALLPSQLVGEGPNEAGLMVDYRFDTISHEAKVSPRQVQLSVARLIRTGELSVARNHGPHGTNLYRLPMITEGNPSLLAKVLQQGGAGAKTAGVQTLRGENSLPPGAQNPALKSQDSAPEPSFESSFEPSSNAHPPPRSAAFGDLASGAGTGRLKEQECKDLFDRFWSLYPNTTTYAKCAPDVRQAFHFKAVFKRLKLDHRVRLLLVSGSNRRGILVAWVAVRHGLRRATMKKYSAWKPAKGVCCGAVGS